LGLQTILAKAKSPLKPIVEEESKASTSGSREERPRVERVERPSTSDSGASSSRRVMPTYVNIKNLREIEQEFINAQSLREREALFKKFGYKHKSYPLDVTKQNFMKSMAERSGE
jgi:hypothetical protein